MKVINILAYFFTVLILTAGFTPKAEAQESVAKYTFPPEWEPHEAMWIDWTDLGGYVTKIEMIDALHRNVKIKLLTHSDSLGRLAINLMLQTGIDTSRIEIFYHPIPNYFLRDSGPKYLTNGSAYKMADFGWDCFGTEDYGEDCYQRGQTENDLAKQFDIPLVSTEVVTEGGALEVNSSTIIAFRQMAEMRNPDKSLAEIEKVFLEMYGKDKMIWIDKIPILDLSGHKVENIFGQGANGHIDEYMRFVNDSTLLVGVIDPVEKDANPINQIDFPILQANLKQIKKETDAAGNSFNIVTLPMPDVNLYARKRPLSKDSRDTHNNWYKDFEVGDTIVYVPIMSYLNFTISNGVVLIHKYWKEGIPESEKKKDEQVFAEFRRLFPDRKIIQINPLDLNWFGGGIHCSTQQQPKLYIRDYR